MYYYKIEIAKGFLKSHEGSTKFLKQIIDLIDFYNKSNKIIKNVCIKYIEESREDL